MAPLPLQSSSPLCLLLLLAAILPLALAADLPHPTTPATPPLVLHAPEQLVQVVTTRDMRGEDTTDADLESLYRENLSVDLSVWQNLNLNMSHLWKLRDLAYQWDREGYFMRMVLIKDNTLYYLDDYQFSNLTHNCDGTNANAFWRSWDEAFNGAWRAKRAAWPDVVFLLNMDDASVCAQKVSPMEPGKVAVGVDQEREGSKSWDCPAPAFSMFKRKHNADILVPSMLHHAPPPLYKFPWNKKKDTAMFRGTLRCELHQTHKDVVNMEWGGCSRLVLANWTFHGPPTHGGRLDVGLTTGYGYFDNELAPKEVPGGLIPPATYVPLKHQARYKWLLALDGKVAPNRFGNMMHVDSVILKQKSDSIEWFYRSMRNKEHYLDIWDAHKLDVIEVMNAWEGRDVDLQKIVAAANAFGELYTSSTARMRYTIKALTEYKRLFPDMDAVIRGTVWPAVQAQLVRSKKGPEHQNLRWSALGRPRGA